MLCLHIERLITAGLRRWTRWLLRVQAARVAGRPAVCVYPARISSILGDAHIWLAFMSTLWYNDPAAAWPICDTLQTLVRSLLRRNHHQSYFVEAFSALWLRCISCVYISLLSGDKSFRYLLRFALPSLKQGRKQGEMRPTSCLNGPAQGIDMLKNSHNMPTLWRTGRTGKLGRQSSCREA